MLPVSLSSLPVLSLTRSDEVFTLTIPPKLLPSCQTQGSSSDSMPQQRFSVDHSILPKYSHCISTEPRRTTGVCLPSSPWLAPSFLPDSLRWGIKGSALRSHSSRTCAPYVTTFGPVTSNTVYATGIPKFIISAPAFHIDPVQVTIQISIWSLKLSMMVTLGAVPTLQHTPTQNILLSMHVLCFLFFPQTEIDFLKFICLFLVCLLC